jgi:FKBP-type peptidyl-prolyl cis-trans isomerase FklB
MKKLLILSVACGMITVSQAQVKPATTKPATTKPAPPALVLKTTQDSLSYVLGEFAAHKLVGQGLGDFRAKNEKAFMAGLNDILDKKKTVIDDPTANALLNRVYMQMEEDKAKVNIAGGEKFLAQNKLRPGVKTTATGLQYEVITEGNGIKPTAVDTFVAHYRGTLLDGTEFDASYKRNQPLTYPVSAVVPGWIEGLQLMSVGSKYKFYVPYNLGYGIYGNPPAIPGGSTLIFELELLDVKKKSQ